VFSLISNDTEQRDADTVATRERLQSLVGVVPGLRSVVFERDLGLIASHQDAVLISEHDDNAALEGYQAHSAHLEAAKFIAAVTGPSRTVVDYEC
jgi:hypothetical protein